MITVPAGHTVHVLLMLDGPMFAAPEPLNTKFPVAPEEVDHVSVANAVPVKFIVELEPGHMLVEEVRLAVGGATTVIVPVAFTDPHPPVSGML